MSVIITSKQLLPVRRDKQTTTIVNVSGGGGIAGGSGGGQPPAYISIIQGTPVAGQVAVFHDVSSIEGDSNFTYDSVTGTLTIPIIDALDGSLKHLIITAGDSASGVQNPGKLVLKAGDAIAGQGTGGGNIYLVPGNGDWLGRVLLGDSNYEGYSIYLGVEGVQTDVSFAFLQKGVGNLAFGDWNTGSTSIYGTYFNLSTANGVFIGWYDIRDEVLSALPGSVGYSHPNGGKLTIKGGDGAGGGNNNGGDLVVIGGKKAGSGVDGSVYLGGTTHAVKIATGGEMTFEGTATVWDDLRILPSTFDFAGGSDPSIVNYQPGGSGTTFKVWEFQLDDQAFFTCQMPHSYKQGTDIYCHVHWTPGIRGNEEGTNAVAWKLDYSWANIGANFGASATIDMTDACENTDHQHLMTPQATITGTSKNISSMLICRIYRHDVAGDTWAGTASGQLPILLEVDFHYEMDTVGSKTDISK
jgi:hypothetical protein